MKRGIGTKIVSINHVKLEQRVIERANKIKCDVDAKFEVINKKPQWQDYVPVVSACQSNRKKRIFYGETGILTAKKTERLLKRVLVRALGPIGEISTRTHCKFPIGHCAEPHAANNLLKVQQTLASLNQIYFSESRRPRTGEVIPPCENCITVFNNVIS
ncbi:MAG: hypothetical protein MJZ20_10040 [Bacteroidaceae bacterium]|nr:hypothetical protein [Bacteroidaceae bacterium]